MSFLRIEGVHARYGKNLPDCLKGLDISVDKGEILAVLGPSGCGKSTLLKVISGLMEQSEGTITIDGEPQEGIPPEKRPVGMVFQKPLLFRNMNVEKNVNYAPRLLSTFKGEELKAETERMLKLAELEGYGDRKVTELSGGHYAL